jgi:hypothetical protein
VDKRNPFKCLVRAILNEAGFYRSRQNFSGMCEGLCEEGLYTGLLFWMRFWIVRNIPDVPKPTPKAGGDPSQVCGEKHSSFHLPLCLLNRLSPPSTSPPSISQVAYTSATI